MSNKILFLFLLGAVACSSTRTVNPEAAHVIITPWRPYDCYFIQTITFKGHAELKEKAHALKGEIATKKAPGVADVFHCDDRRAR